MIQFQCTHCDNRYSTPLCVMQCCSAFKTLWYYWSSFGKIPCCSNNKKLYGGTLIWSASTRANVLRQKFGISGMGGNRKVYPPPTPTRPLGITRPLPDITPTRLNPNTLYLKIPEFRLSFWWFKIKISLQPLRQELSWQIRPISYFRLSQLQKEWVT